MHCSCTMMSPSDISLVEEEGANVEGANEMELNGREELLNLIAKT